MAITYGDRAADVWWEQSRAGLEQLENLTVLRLSGDEAQALAGLARRSMRLQCTIQDGEALVSGDDGAVRVTPAVLCRPDAG